MALNEKMTLRIREALAHLPNVAEKKMFRGIAFMVDGKLCVSAGDDEMMCRIDPGMHGKALEKKGVRTVIMKGREYQGYVYVNESVLRRKRDLIHWIGLSLAFNKQAKASVKRRKS